MRKLVGAIVAGIAAGALAGPASAGQTHPGTLNFDGAEFGGGVVRFHGDVESSPATCRRDRKITLFRTGTNSDVKVGTTRSDSFSFWSLSVPEADALAGTYYAKMAVKRLKNGGTCTGDRSPNMLIV